MPYDFLKDFHKRIEMVAIVDFITTRVSRKVKLKGYGFEASETTNLCMLVLCFIMEKSLVGEACTKSDIAVFLRKMDIGYIKKSIQDEEYMNLANILIKDCLQNNGIPHYFSTYDFEAGNNHNYHSVLQWKGKLHKIKRFYPVGRT